MCNRFQSVLPLFLLMHKVANFKCWVVKIDVELNLSIFLIEQGILTHMYSMSLLHYLGLSHNRFDPEYEAEVHNFWSHFSFNHSLQFSWDCASPMLGTRAHITNTYKVFQSEKVSGLPDPMCQEVISSILFLRWHCKQQRSLFIPPISQLVTT